MNLGQRRFNIIWCCTEGGTGQGHERILHQWVQKKIKSVILRSTSLKVSSLCWLNIKCFSDICLRTCRGHNSREWVYAGLWPRTRIYLWTAHTSQNWSMTVKLHQVFSTCFYTDSINYLRIIFLMLIALKLLVVFIFFLMFVLILSIWLWYLLILDKALYNFECYDPQTKMA